MIVLLESLLLVACNAWLLVWSRAPVSSLSSKQEPDESLLRPFSLSGLLGTYHNFDNDFPTTNTSRHLQAISALGPRPYNSFANRKAMAYIVEKMQSWINEFPLSDGKTPRGMLEVDRSSVEESLKWYQFGKLAWPGKAMYDLQIENIVAKAIGQCEVTHGLDSANCHSLLVSCHYDSATVGTGSTDDGIACTVMMEIFHQLLQQPRLQHSVIFLINNAEEMHLLGAHHFTRHRWFGSVKGFINLEGAGFGGPSMLFRATDTALLKAYSEFSPMPHASVIGNDVFKTGLIKSDTDYSVFIKKKVPGLDIAFYQNRYRYHTAQDTYSSHLLPAIHHMGTNTLALVTGIANSSSILDSIGEPAKSPGAYWDHYFSISFVVEYKRMAAISFLFCAISVILLMAGQKQQRLSMLRRRLLRHLLTATYAVILPASAFIQIEKLKPFALYANVELWRMITITSILLCAGIPYIIWPTRYSNPLQSALSKPSKEAVSDILPTSGKLKAQSRNQKLARNSSQDNVSLRILDAQLEILAAATLLLVFATITALFGYGMLYQYTLWSAFVLAATLLDWLVLCPILGLPKSLRWSLYVLATHVVPFALCFHFYASLVKAMEPTVQDGTPLLIVPVLGSILSLPFSISFWIQFAADPTQKSQPNRGGYATLFGGPLRAMGLTLAATMALATVALVTIPGVPLTAEKPLKVCLHHDLDFSSQGGAPVLETYTLFNGKVLEAYHVAQEESGPTTKIDSWLPVNDANLCRWVNSTSYVYCNISHATSNAIYHESMTPPNVTLPPQVQVKTARTGRLPDGNTVDVFEFSVRHPLSRLCFVESMRESHVMDWIKSPSTTTKPPYMWLKHHSDDPVIDVPAGAEDTRHLVGMPAEFGAAANFSIAWPDISGGVNGGIEDELRVGCIIDDLSVLPGVAQFENDLLPPWATLLGPGMGMLRVYVRFGPGMIRRM